MPAAEATGSRADDVRAYVRGSILKGGLVLLGLTLVLGLAGILYEEELLAVTRGVEESLGLFGLALILFLSDAVFTPIPPDLVLIVIAKSELHANWMVIVPALGVMSAFAGLVGWWLGTKLGDTARVRRVLARVREKNEALITRYGRLGVVLGALTPIPFSITCWLAGALRMPGSHLAQVTWLRVPRFLAYYVLFAYSDDIVRFLFWR
jgi:membrane protein YqaA with SNARE-associated domain